MARLYISQTRLDSWTAQNRVRLEGNCMTLVEDGRSFKMVPAVRFLALTAGTHDSYQLVGTVKDAQTLASMGAQHGDDSVVLGEVSYHVQCGFMGAPLASIE